MSASVALFVASVCLLESLPEGVLARGCAGGEEWTIAAPPLAPADVAVKGGDDWKRHVVDSFRGTDAGPCGFDVHDLMLRGDTLWVATDLGISRLRLSREDWDEWSHYTRAADGSALAETACASVLSTVAEAASQPGGEQLAARLAEFRPRFWKRHQRRVSAARRSSGTRPASPARRRRNEQAVGNARGAGAGRGADVHPRPFRRPQAA